LHYAVDLENKEIIEFLLKNGADPNISDNTGSTPVDEIMDNKELELIFDGIKQ